MTSGVKSDIPAPMGRYGCDPPAVLIDTMLDAFNREHGKQDVIFLLGDMSGHHTAMPVDDPTYGPSTYPLLLESLSGLATHLAAKFPDTLIIPTFGNNDPEYHDNPIPVADQDFYYRYTYDLFFKVLPGNRSKLTDEQKVSIHETFMKGGYYRVDLTDKISVLALNTLYYDSNRATDN